jgi:hypothetical protein
MRCAFSASTPLTAILLWLSSLALRAIVCLLAVIYLLFFMPGSGLFVALTHWCAHVALPASGGELAVEGHGVGALSLYVPGIVLASSLLWMCVAGMRDAHAARLVIAQHAVGAGPRNSVIVGGPDVLFAVSGLIRPRIVVSVRSAHVAGRRRAVRRTGARRGPHRPTAPFRDAAGRRPPGARPPGAGQRSRPPRARVPARTRRRPLGAAPEERPHCAGQRDLQGGHGGWDAPCCVRRSGRHRRP